MNQIEELQSRITAAMDRISAGIENLSVVPVASDVPDTGDLAAALDEEKVANAQLEERLKTLKARHAEEIEALQADATPQEDVEALKAELAEARTRLDDTSEADGLKSELAEATAKLMAAEAAKTELAEAKAALEAADESELLKAEIEALKAQIDAAEDAEPYKAEVAELRSQLENTEEVDGLRGEIEALKARLENTDEADGLREEIASLKAELNASERLEDLKTELDMLRAERVSHGEAMTRLDGDLQRLRKANDQLREANAALRDANEAGVGEPHLINKAMLAELEGLRAVRASDAAEVHAVLARLEPVLAQASLAEGEDE